MGLIWLSLTMLFEFGFGHFVMNRSWGALLEDYNIFEGKIRAIVLIVTLAGPYLADKLV